MAQNFDYKLIHIGIQWYVVGNGCRIPVEDEISGLLLIDQLIKEAQDTKSCSSKSVQSQDYDQR
ncbi:hypothetical protein [Desulfonatronovibrio magnus]|uniref:hypothetical protein n=1 Tax=Desulfonatronovibrio magnus TaxID=698827 RepID=UPI0005EBDAA2|nr:hypothetical protein [Desulfonatronovibrio magnus]